MAKKTTRRGAKTRRRQAAAEAPDVATVLELTPDVMPVRGVALDAASLLVPAAKVRVVARRRPAVTAADAQRVIRQARSRRVVLIEGDSWYNFPVPFARGLDRALEARHDYDTTLHFAEAGDTLRAIVFGNDRRDLTGVLEALRAVQPRVMLFSGGGNDVVGPEFINYLNHKLTGRPILREAFVELQFQEVFLPAYRYLIEQVRQASPETKLFVHGYAHPFPSGKGVDIAFLDDLGVIRIGPWIKPSLDATGWGFEDGRRAVRALIDRFNAMLAQLQREYAGMFWHVDLRRTVTRAAQWRDELHLTNDAADRCADVIHRLIAGVIPGW